MPCKGDTPSSFKVCAVKHAEIQHGGKRRGAASDATSGVRYSRGGDGIIIWHKLDQIGVNWSK